MGFQLRHAGTGATSLLIVQALMYGLLLVLPVSVRRLVLLAGEPDQVCRLHTSVCPSCTVPPDCISVAKVASSLAVLVHC